ncbi:hypothetical protein H6F51_21370 [Cyanobacteria bacterium FACHB-DQ100]|nr:hypothetical protein [Cyanobacteria bacterium FACHB-DQ100]
MLESALQKLENARLRDKIEHLTKQLEQTQTQNQQLTRKLARLEHQAKVEKFDAIETALKSLIASGHIRRCEPNEN